MPTDQPKETALAETPLPTNYAVFPGDSEMAALMRQKDWARTNLGPVEQWPQSLKTAVDILLNARYPMFVWWGEALINLYNDPYALILGTKHPQAMGNSGREAWAEIWDQVGPLAEKVMRHNQATFMEDMLLFMERNGYLEETYFTFSYSPILNDQGVVGGLFCACTEETQQVFNNRQMALLRELAANTAEARTVDDACARSASILKSNLRDVPFALIYQLDSTQANSRLVEATGIERGHAAAPEKLILANNSVWPFQEALTTGRMVLVSDIGKRLEALPNGPWDRPPDQAVVLPLAQSGQTGQAGFLVMGLNPFRRFDESYQGFVNLASAQISASIANAQAYEEERKRSELLAEINQAKTAFFSNVSHEFRTPLTLMLGPLEDALRDSDTTPVNRQRLDVAHRNTLRLQRLVNTLLDFSRIESGRLQATYRPTDLSAYTAELASMFRSAVEKAGLKLKVSCPPLPEPVYVDREMWEKIVLNLMSNAFKHTFAGEIEVSLGWTGHGAALTVRDTGVGIPENQLPHLFERFHRVPDTRSRTHEGSGIGLTLVQELVHLHGGEIQAQSVLNRGNYDDGQPSCRTGTLAPGAGTDGWIPVSTAIGIQSFINEANRWLPDEKQPFSLETPMPSTELPSAAWTGTAPKAVGRARIILAEDNADLRGYIQSLLSPYCAVEAVSDGKKALEAAHRETPDLILSDVMMPEMDGFELLNALRADSALRAVPIILLSARAGEEAKVEGLQAGADDYLTKPFSARELLARVKSNLDLYRVRREAVAREQSAMEIVDSIRAELDLESVLQKAVTRLGQLTRADRCAFWLYDAENDQFQVPRYEYHSERCVAAISDTAYPQNPVLPQKLSYHEVIRYRDIRQADGLTEADWRMIDERGIKSLLHVPILHKGALLGTLRIHTVFKHQEWDDETISMVLYLGAQVAVAIYQAQLLKRLQESEARKTAVFESSLDAITTMNHNGIVVDWNAAAEKMFGYTREQAVGQDMATLIIPHRFREAHYKGIGHYLRTGEGPVMNKLMEMPALRADGSEFISELTISRTPTEGLPLFTGTLRDITDRKQTEQALKESEVRFRNLADTAPMYMAMADEHGNAVYFNKPWLEYTGKTMDEMTGMDWLCTLHPEDAPKFERDFKQAFADRVPIKEEYRFRRADGEYRWMLAVGGPRFTPDGRFIGYFGTYADFHELKEAQLAQQESEKRFRTIADESPVFIFMVGDNAEVEYWNKTFLEFSGLSFEEMSGRSWDKMIHPNDLEATVKVYMEAFNARKPYTVECRFKDVQGEYRWILWKGSPLFLPDGKFVRYMGTGVDIHDRKMAEDIIVKSESRFRTLADALPQLVWMTRPDGFVEYFNQRWYDFTYTTPEQTLGDQWISLLYPEDKERTLEAWNQSIATGKRYEVEYRLYGGDGHYRWFLARGVPIYDTEGNITQWFGSCTDIENQKQAERELEQFAIIASHDLQEPLRKILIFGDMIAPMLAPEGHNYLRRMQSAANRMQNLVTDLLTLSRINRKGKPFRTIDLNRLIAEVLENLHIAIVEADAHVSVETLGLAYGDYQQLQQLVQNLVGNAIKYRHPDKAPTIKIYGHPSQDGHYYQLTVEDDGIGIKPEYFARIFEPFERLHGMDSYPGTGMGLAICKEILKRHKGSISVSSEENQGSRFTFSVPIGLKSYPTSEESGSALSSSEASGI